MFNFRSKGDKKDLISLLEERYKKKGITGKSLRGEVYKIGKAGFLTATSGTICVITATGFVVGMYSIYERIFSGDNYRLHDDALFFTAKLGFAAVAFGFGTKLLSRLTIKNYQTLRTNYRKYREKGLEGKT